METVLIIGGVIALAAWAKGRAAQAAIGTDATDPMYDGDEPDLGVDAYDYFPTSGGNPGGGGGSGIGQGGKKLWYTGPDVRPMPHVDPVTGRVVYGGYAAPPVPINRTTGLVGSRKYEPLQCGGGGPENAGATPVNDLVTALPISQPSWWWESDNDYLGYALKTQRPLLAGGDPAGIQPQDGFRFLGDTLGGRQ